MMVKTAEPHTFFNDLMQTLTGRARALLSRARSRADRADLVDLAEMLLSRRGEASGVVLAQMLLNAYEHVQPGVRLEFLTSLLERFGPDERQLRAAVQAFQKSGDAASTRALQAAVEPRRQELLRRLNLAPGGTFALVQMREELLEHAREHPDLATVDADFAHLFSSWFNRGFLEMRPIQWITPANILEKIIRYEAVHPLAGWSDLKSRLAPADRRCFAFFHPQLADEPLIFVQVALATEIPSAIAPLLAQRREPLSPESATAAIFYSISNTQRGLAGVSFGNFLIKQVVEDLKRTMPMLKNFATLSPVPGFAAWLARERAAEDSRFLDARQKAKLGLLDEPEWFDKENLREKVEVVLIPVAASYFLHAKTASGRPVDPVARFHLGNGARLDRLNFLADASERGMKQAHGLMVNYVYDLPAIERNHESYAERGEIIASPAVRRISKRPGLRDLIPVNQVTVHFKGQPASAEGANQ